MSIGKSQVNLLVSSLMTLSISFDTCSTYGVESSHKFLFFPSFWAMNQVAEIYNLNFNFGITKLYNLKILLIHITIKLRYFQKLWDDSHALLSSLDSSLARPIWHKGMWSSVLGSIQSRRPVRPFIATKVSSRTNAYGTLGNCNNLNIAILCIMLYG